jgi:ATP-binding cassette subfamily B (MDR/TAP) protein 1
MVASAASVLVAKIRSLSFRAILRQDSEFYTTRYCETIELRVLLLVEYFDKDENSAGGLTASLSDNAQKISGLAGITLGT